MKKLLILVAGLASVVGCEKGVESIEVDSTVYFPVSGYVEASALLGSSTYYVTLYKAGLEASPAVTVNVSVDEAKLAEFKAANAGYSHLELLPADYYSLETTSVEIPKNSYMAYLKIGMKNIGAGFVGTNYVLPLAITNASKGSVNDEKSVVFLHFGGYKNIYAGVYKASGASVDDKGQQVTIDGVKTLSTAGQRKVTTWVSTDTAKSMELTFGDDGSVTILGASGMEQYSIKNDPTQVSSWGGSFDAAYQRFRGSMTLHYTYSVTQTVAGNVMTTAYSVSETLQFTL